MISQLLDISGPLRVGPRGVVRAEPIAGSIRHDQAYTTPRRRARLTREVEPRSRRTVEREERRTVGCAVLDERELAAVGMPSVLVPLPGAPGDHQTANAQVFAAAGAAVLVPDAELDAARLRDVLDPLLTAPDRVRSMSDAARGLARPDAAARFADLVEATARV